MTTAASARILARCDELAAISSHADRLERVHLTPEHAAASALVDRWMTEAGMTTWQDAAGNRCGRVEGREPGLPALLLGSHIDTVPDAGRYDGMLGVLLAIAVVERLPPESLPFAVEVVAFSDEEGTRFGAALTGSRALAGSWDDGWWNLVDADGITLAEAFEAFGLDPTRIQDAARRPDELVGYLEAHIEQGPMLDDADRALAVVTSIAAARRFDLTIVGHAGHAGGSPYDRRRDALVGASELVVAVERISIDRGVIGTVGRLQAFPGGVNVIPGRVDFSLDLRAEFDADRDDAAAEIFAQGQAIAARRGLEFAHREIYRADAVVCDLDLRAAVEVGIRAVEGQSAGDHNPAAHNPVAHNPIALWSRAGHDGMAVSAVAPVGMLFVRCAGGVSHHPAESVTHEDVAAALTAFEASVLAVAASARA